MSDTIPEKRIWLAIPHDKREEAKEQGGKLDDGRNAIQWSKEDELWYARPGTDVKRIKDWLPDPTIRSSGGDPHEEFLDALTNAGLIIEGLPVMDGEIHRVSVTDGPAGNGDGVYRGFLNGRKPGGWFINYWTAPTHKDITKWKASGNGGEADPVARLHMKALARQSKDDSARKLAETQARQTAKAKWLYSKLPAADPNHPYLIRKGVAAEPDFRQTNNGALVIPLYDVNGNFRTLQYIPPDGEKTLYEKAPKVGNFFVVGGRLTDGEPVLYAEGYATAKSLNMLTGHPVVMTVDAGNMLNVARVLSERYPTSPHIFMADNDHAKPVNTGLVMARQSAINTGGEFILPDLTDAERRAGYTDFNDIHLSRGMESLRATLMPQISQALERLSLPEKTMSTPDDAKPAPENSPAPETVATTAAAIEPVLNPASGPASTLTPVDDNPLQGAEPVSPKTAGRPGSAKEHAGEILKAREAGLKPAEIAEKFKVSQTSVYRILKAQQPEAADKTGSEASVVTQDNADISSGVTAPVITSDDLPAAVISESGFYDAGPEPEAAATTGPAVNTTRATLNPEDIARAMAFSGQGLSLARVAAEMNLGMTETLNLLRAGKEQEAAQNNQPQESRPEWVDYDQNPLSDTLTVNAANEKAAQPSGEGEPSEPEPGSEAEKRAENTRLAAESAFGEENAILVGAPRVAPQDEDAPASSGATASPIDADKLLSRITHEKQPNDKSVLYRLDGEPAFIDRGTRLVMADGASNHEEKVLAALLTAANHYHGRIELTGSDAFKAFAIGVIVANKLNVSMKDAMQQADLDTARRAAGQPVTPATPADAVRGEPGAPRATEAPPVTSSATTAPATQPVQNTQHVTASQQQKPQQPQQPQQLQQLQQQPQNSAAAPEPAVPKISPAVHTPAEKAREPVTGKVTACGQAPFRFETGQSESTFITLQTKEGPHTFWGKELAGLLRQTNLEPGRMVTLQWQGEQPVTVKVPKKNDEGVVTHYEHVQTHRNQWSLVPLGGTRVQTGTAEMVPLAAVDVNRYTQIQQTLVSRLGLYIDEPPRPADGLYWVKPDGQGSAQPGDALSAPRPPHNERAGTPVMSEWGKDGRPDLLLVQGDGDYLQGVVRQNGVYQHVLVSLPGNAEAPPMVVNLLTPEGAQPIGSGNGINRSGGQPVPREHVVVRLTGDTQQRIAKLDAPADVPAALHARLGYDERYKAESGWVKEQPAAAPQAAPVTPPRPAQ
ncbi:DNA primase (plasmid) [Pantoea sp. JZ29]|uniref:LPD7 domain-containing protein n=1 Tax=Pantoea sp. JZ29 TaxID=2654192 RepID=UPI002B4A0C86|nr:LPD7 domain-containing protein [Pantoea sp. JZ29]WRH23559.1 DNA primase [Pantoea sp. JZ29]